jgi:hypothetical protein
MNLRRMSLVVSMVLLCGAALAARATTPVTASATTEQSPSAAVLSARVPFIRNAGQIASQEVRFYAQTFAGTMFVTADDALVYAVPVRGGDGARRTWAFRESFAGAGPARATGGHPSATRVSYFKGQDPSGWRSGLETFDSVELGELYPAIRVGLRAAGGSVEKLFHVAPGGDVQAIAITIDGVDAAAVDAGHRLVLSASGREIAFSAPVAYQIVDGRRRPVDVDYVLAGDRRYGFEVGDYDRSRDLVIDPLIASTYLGGHNPQPPGNYDDDIIRGMATLDGDVIVAGATQSPDFPVHMGYDETLASNFPDGFVTRTTSDLSTIVASTYIGTQYSDYVGDVAVDGAGTVVAVGQAGWGFPVTDGAYNWQGTTPVGGGFLLRFSGDLSTLMASAMVTPVDYPRKMALGNGGIYFGGTTNYPGFPITSGAWRSTCCPAGAFGIREYDGFAGKLSLDLSTLLTMTYLGGDSVTGMSVAADGGVFITDGFDYGLRGYLARFDDGLTERPGYLSYSGSGGGGSRTYFNDVVAAGGRVVAVGQTYMNSLPATEGAFDTTCGTDALCDPRGPFDVPTPDGFVAIYSEDLVDTIALSYFGGSGAESIRSLALSASGDIYVTGETASVDLPTAGDDVDVGCGADGACDGAMEDGFLARFSTDLSRLDFGTYHGGSGGDFPLVVGVDPGGLARVAGFTDSVDFPTTDGAFDRSYNGGTSDAFVSVFATGEGIGGDAIFADGFESGDLSAWSDSVQGN